MVSLEFKLSDLGKIDIELDGPLPLGELIRRYGPASGEDAGSYIAVRAGEVIQEDSLIHDGETVILLPAISGG